MILSGEMASMYPVSGAFSTFGTRFVSPALGFALGEFQFLSCYLNKHEMDDSDRLELLVAMVSIIMKINFWTI